MDQESLSRLVNERGAKRGLLWLHPPSGLQAVVIIDSDTLGPAAGGIRTRVYPSLLQAADDAAALARAMTLKCALGGLAAGGCKIVVREPPKLHRSAAFAELGRRIQALDGEVHTAGDFGTTDHDLAQVAKHTKFVHTEGGSLATSVGRGVLACVRACLSLRAKKTTVDHQGSLSELHVAVQGCGKMGTAVAHALASAGAKVFVSDIVPERALDLARQLGTAPIHPGDYWTSKVDLLAPCAGGAELSPERAEQLHAQLIVGAANNLLTAPAVAEILMRRKVTLVPDVVSSAGAVVDGCGQTLMGLSDRAPLIDRLGDTALEIMLRGAKEGASTSAIATTIAEERLARATQSASH